MKNKALIFITMAIFIAHIKAQDPPADWQEHWLEHDQLVTLHSFDDHVALYYDNEMDQSITWPLDRSSQIWAYTKTTYGDFGGQPRLFVVLHQNKYSGGHPSTFFDESHDFRNVIDIGQDGSWADPVGWNIGVIAHEISHIVELASHGVHNSPAFGIWGDSKWAEIFNYDVYNKLGWTVEAEQSIADGETASDDFPRPGTQWFKNWFHPIYRDHGETEVLKRYFQLLADNFPKTALTGDFAQYFQYDRDMNFGEFVHFWSGAANTDLRELALSAFGDKDQDGNDWVPQFEQAQRDFPNLLTQPAPAEPAPAPAPAAGKTPARLRCRRRV